MSNIHKNTPSHYVGIGASAGGLDAIEEFIQNMPADTGMAFIVVQHLSPDYKSMMVELLSRKTKMEVLQIEDGMLVEANRIYLIPPKKNLEIYHEQLFLTEQVRDTGINLPIDIFFRSLATDQRKNAIGIILSGTGSDGALGVRAIKEKGGMVMVQDYTHAKFDGMPKSAIATGLVDYILEAGKMSEALVKYIKHPLVKQNAEKEPNKEETDFVKILSLIRTHVGEDFSYYKPKTIIRRIERRISVNQFHDAEEYIQLLLHSREECEILAKEFLIGVTQFFRDKEAFDILENEVIPKVFRAHKSNKPLRIWSVGCSTGEEAYSIAILCKEYMLEKNLDIDLKIFATDLDKEAVKFAGFGAYPRSIISDVSQEYLTRYFVEKHDSYQVNEEIRQMVIFSNHNVITDPPFSKIDLVVCRNLLIYFKADMQQRVLGLFQYSLSKGGYLFLGNSESLSGVSDAFEVINSKWKIFKYKEGLKTPLLAGLLDVPKRGKTQSLSSINQPQTPNEEQKEQIQLYEQAIIHFAPAGVIVDNNNIIIHFFKNIQKYLNFPQGRPSYNLLELANPQLSMVLSNMLYKVRKEKQEVTLSKVKFETEEETRLLSISAIPVTLGKNNHKEFVIVSIEEKEHKRQSTPEGETSFNYDEQAIERIKELEQELQYREENLQTTVEELETSNEELQATNEELVSSNEELQSTNEELQSVNEELYTVNSQYQEKINELTTLNNDMNNLLENTHIGTLFLDSQLTVRKFTSQITKIINVMEIDVGRPFAHLTTNCNYSNLVNDVKDVLDTLIVKELEIEAGDQWYLLKIQPYRHADNSIHGVLLTQINITALKRATENNLKLSNAVEQSADIVIITDLEGTIEYINKSFTNITGYSRKEIIGAKPNILKSGKHSDTFYKNLWETITSGKTWKGEFQNRKKNGDLYWETSTISPLKNEKGEIINYLAIKEDITEKKHIEKELRESEERYRKLFETMTQGVVYQDFNGQIISVNPAAENILGLTLDQLQGRTSTDKRWKSIYPNGEEFPGEKHPAMVALRTGKTIRNVIMGVYNPKTDATKWIKVNAIPHFRNNETQPYEVYATLDDVTEQWQAEQKIQQKNEEIQRKNKALRKTNEALEKTVDDLNLSQKKYNMLFNSLSFGFAYHKIITNNKGEPVDYEFLKVNKVFEQLTGLSAESVVGKRIREILPETEDFWIQKYGKVALDNETLELSHYSRALGKYFKVSSYSPQTTYFVTIFEEIKKEEQTEK